jgi:probable phosphoglycerate mutase
MKVIYRENMLPRLYLIRYGETEWPLSGQHTSRAEIPLGQTPHSTTRCPGRIFRR